MDVTTTRRGGVETIAESSIEEMCRWELNNYVEYVLETCRS